MAECPFCEYEGSTSSVEAHISGSRDEAHSGRLGSNHRGLVRASVPSPDEPVEESGGGDQPDDLAPSVALVAASAVLVIIVLAGSSGSAESSDPSEPVGEEW